MNDLQLERLNSYIRSAQVLDDNSAAMDISLPQHTPFETQLDDIISQIVSEAGLGSQDDTGETIDQNLKRRSVESLHLKVANAAAAWYVTQNNKGDLMRVKTTRHKLQAMAEEQFYISSRRLVDIATPISADLINADATDVAALNAANEEYFAIFKNPEQAKGNKKMHNATVNALLKQALEVRKSLTILINTLAGTADNNIYMEWKSSLSFYNTGPIKTPAFTEENSINASSVNNIDISSLAITGNTEIKLTNTGNVELKFGFSTADNNLPAGSPAVSRDNNVRFTATGIGYLAGSSIFLNVRNQKGSSGNYRVEVFIME